MKPDTAFDTHQSTVNAAPESVRDARRRRNFFCDALSKQADVTETIPSGSLARGTQRDPIHDVDLIIVFREEDHPDWGASGSASAEAALEHIRGQVTSLLGVTSGSFAQEVRRADLRTHVVKCFLDDPGDPGAFAVEVMPALRRLDGTLRIPERGNEAGWVTADPEFLISEVAARHREWRSFAPMVRAIKKWKDVAGIGMKSLTAEVLALKCLPVPQSGQVLTRPVALQQFFTGAAAAVMSGVFDPAGWCGEIQPGLDRAAVRAALLEAADVAARAVDAERRGDYDTAVCLWRSVFGPDFPEPPGGCPGSGKTASAGLITAGAAVSSAPAFIRRPVKDAPQG
jgi:predicted nucleotidyltransferase